MRISLILFVLEWLCLLAIGPGVAAGERKPSNANQDERATVKLEEVKKNCYLHRDKVSKWAVVDLKATYQIHKVKILWDINKWNVDSFSFHVGEQFSPCQFDRQVERYSTCKVPVNTTLDKREVVCDDNSARGQYLAIVEHPMSNKRPGHHDLCRVEVEGTLIPDGPKRMKPTMSEGDEGDPPTNTFKILKKIRKDVNDAVIPSLSTVVDYVNENCEPIVWDQETYSTFAVACETRDGKGRIVVSGKDGFFRDLTMKGQEQLKVNLLEWLSHSKPNPNVVRSETFKTAEDIDRMIKDGDIIDLDVSHSIPPQVLQAVKSLLLKGSIGLNVDHSFQTGSSSLEFLDMFNVDFSSTSINSGKETRSSFSQSDLNEALVGLEERVRRLSLSHKYLMKYGSDVSRTLERAPIKLLVNTKIKSHLEAIITKYNDLLVWKCPCSVNPVEDPTDWRFVAIIGRLMKSQLLVHSEYKLPCIDAFPGDFSSPVEKRNVRLSIDSEIEDVLNPTGFYLAAGSTVEYEVDYSQGSWTMRIGCHPDDLSEKAGQLTRYPEIVIDVPLVSSGKGNVYSPYGGNIWLRNLEVNQSITITMKNVVETPFFNARDPRTIDNWNKQKTNKGLWAQIAGDNIVFCVDSKQIRHFRGEHIFDTMRNNWDRLVKMDLEWAAFDWRKVRPQLFVLDKLVIGGGAHPGYPIVATTNWFSGMFKAENETDRSDWGLCHEIGHNMQAPAWLFRGSTEVTNNLFCIMNYAKHWKKPRYGSDAKSLVHGNNKYPIIKEFLDNVTFERWKATRFAGLLTYAQMLNHFGFGFYHKVFKYYRDKDIRLYNSNPKMKKWMEVTSIVSGYNLVPMFEFWGFPFTSEVNETLSHLPCFFPVDFVLEISEVRKKFAEKYLGKCQSKSKYYEDMTFKTLDWEMRPNNIKQTFL